MTLFGYLFAATLLVGARTVSHPVVPPTSGATYDKIADLINRKQYRFAEALLERLPTPKDAALRLKHETLLSRSLVAQKKYKEAEPLLVRLIEADPTLADRHLYELAKARFNQNEFASALEAARGVDEAGLFAAEAEVVRVLSLYELQNIDEAFDRCEKHVPEKINAEWRYACGRVWLSHNEPARAEQALRDVVRRDILKPEAKKAHALLLSLPHYRALAASDLAFAKGEQLLKRRRVDASKGYFETSLALANDPLGSAEATLRLSDIAERKQRLQQGLDGYMRAAELAPGTRVSADALFAAGTLATRMKNLSLAQTVYQRLLVEHPLAEGRSQALFGLGFTAYLAHDFQAAQQFLGSLLEQELHRVDKQRARYWLGRAREAMNLRAEAQIAFSEILRDDPAGYYAVRADHRLRTLGMEALPLMLEPPPPPTFRAQVVGLVKSILALSQRALKGEAVRMMERIARGTLPTQDDAKAVRDGFLELGETVKAEVVLAVWRYEHLGALSPSEREETIRMRHPRFFGDIVAREAGKKGLPAHDVFAVIRQESRFIANARSPSGARGLMQLMIPTAKEVGRALKTPLKGPDHLFQPELNIKFGTHYLSWLIKRYPDKELAVAAYNAGIGNVQRWQNLFGDLPVDVFCELIPFAETKDYVQRVLGYSRGYEMTSRPQTALAE
jgi:soluble lytic murein transglycosylase-like protein